MHIVIFVALQMLVLVDKQGEFYRYSISTATKGVGEQSGSMQTPRGRHIIKAKIGEGLPENAVLVSRRFTGEIYSESLRAADPNRDWVLTRILWLSGLEPGVNRSGEVDSMRRYIYIHGTNEIDKIGTPASHGCIRMCNDDLLDLFDRVDVNTPVTIIP